MRLNLGIFYWCNMWDYFVTIFQKYEMDKFILHLVDFLVQAKCHTERLSIKFSMFYYFIENKSIYALFLFYVDM